MKVRVSQGVLLGETDASGIHSFKGIPFARPPVGEFRWKAPLPAENWEGTRPARQFGQSPVQPRRPSNTLTYQGEEPQSEDCLYANVWSGTTDRHEKRPVIVWIFYGAFLMGSGAGPIWNGTHLASKGAVVVTFNHRLGRFGFLAHPELSGEAPYGRSGNYGLLDQIELLKWVQENIASFGGDPDCVTLMGQSSGASSINLLMTSPLARGLFHRAIVHSGGQFERTWRNEGWPALSDLDDAEKDGLVIQSEVGAANIAQMRQKTSDEILFALSDGGKISWRNGLVNNAFIGGYPIVDGHVVPAGGVRDIFERGKQIDVPLLAGFTRNEGGGKTWKKTCEEHVAAAKAEFGSLADAFLRVYPCSNDAEALKIGGQVVGDQIFAWQTWTLLRMHQLHSRHRVFGFHYAHVPPFPPGIDLAETSGDPAIELAAMHGMEIPYVFGTFEARDWSWRESDHALSRMMSDYWLNFAASGDPNGQGLPVWGDFGQGTVMEFGPQAHMQSIMDLGYSGRFEFWDRAFGINLSAFQRSSRKSQGEADA